MNYSIHLCWLLMLLGILMEVTATVALKFTDGFTRWLPSLTAGLCYAATFPLLMLALKKIPVGTAYPVWNGLGTLLIFTLGSVLFNETVNATKIISVVLIILGIAGLNSS